ncbi:hypothetical protein VTN49DRAFT_6272 [Thermomyces lanuginosus]|uniref:uncharacterized protein n=1 Tax=Thermomyces lanuginosus TaxID=5541 RepID=UPI0037440795
MEDVFFVSSWLNQGIPGVGGLLQGKALYDHADSPFMFYCTIDSSIIQSNKQESNHHIIPLAPRTNNGNILQQHMMGIRYQRRKENIFTEAAHISPELQLKSR